MRFITTEDKYGRRTADQRREINLQSMRTAAQEAQYVALTALGYDAEITPGNVVVQEMLCLTDSEDGPDCLEYYPSDAEVDPADTILEADGKPLASVDDLVAALADKRPGDTVELVIDRPGTGEMTVTVELSASPQDPDRTIVGFQPFDTRVVQLPFEVAIETGDIGGPSAGLSFTLALIDQLSPGQLTGGRNVAVTGTIAPRRLGRCDRRVGPEGLGGAPERCGRVPRPGVTAGAERPGADADADRCGPWAGRDHPGGDARRGPRRAREARRRPPGENRLGRPPPDRIGYFVPSGNRAGVGVGNTRRTKHPTHSSRVAG